MAYYGIWPGIRRKCSSSLMKYWIASLHFFLDLAFLMRSSPLQYSQMDSFSCGSSNLFRYWIHHYTHTKNVTLPRYVTVDHSLPNYLGCYISRKGELQSGQQQRRVSNVEEVFSAMKSSFNDVREIHITGRSSTSDIVQMVQDCSALFGVHGAGMMNTIFGQPSAVVLEILPLGGDPAYYRNINMLAGHRYIGLKSNFSMSSEEVVLDTKTIKEVLSPAIVLDA